MRVIDPGHVYSLDLLDTTEHFSKAQVLTFVKREGEKYPGNRGSHPGTTSQEVLRALIDRANYVNAQEPCAETELAGQLMKAALYLLEVRAARKHGRTLSFSVAQVLHEVAKCEKCGHIGCHGGCRR